MRTLLRVLFWLFLWPFLLPIWLWKHGRIGKAFASFWVVFLVILGFSGRPQQNRKIPIAPKSLSNITANKQVEIATSSPTILTPQATLTEVNIPTPLSTIDEPIVLTKTPIPTATLLPVLTDTTQPPLTSTPTQTPVPTNTEPPSPTPTTPPTVTVPDTEVPTTVPSPIVPTSTPVIAEATVAPLTQSHASNPNAFTCINGCAEPPDPSCAIKGNVNSKGDHIYHIPGWRDYERTTIKPEEGDRWFCTEEEAQNAGFRAPKNH